MVSSSKIWKHYCLGVLYYYKDKHREGNIWGIQSAPMQLWWKGVKKRAIRFQSYCRAKNWNTKWVKQSKSKERRADKVYTLNRNWWGWHVLLKKPRRGHILNFLRYTTRSPSQHVLWITKRVRNRLLLNTDWASITQLHFWLNIVTYIHNSVQLYYMDTTEYGVTYGSTLWTKWRQ